MKRYMHAAMLVSAMTLALLSGAARTAEVPIVTGEHWVKSSEEMKKAYLLGIANMALIELAYQGPTPVADSQSVIARMAKGLKGQTLDSVREGLNKWYAANSDRVQRPVLETIWFEMVVPGLQKNN
jgi:hypothetical protein